MIDIPWKWRMVSFGAFLVVGLLLDGRRPKSERHRWREYSVLAVSGWMAAGFGMAVDGLTWRISPAYFQLGKRLSAESDFLEEVLILGLRSGFSFGVIGAAILLFFNGNPRRAFQVLPDCFRCLGWSALSGLGAYLFVPALLPIFGVLPSLYPETALRFLLVWFIHLGIYLGGSLGIALCSLRLVLRSNLPRNLNE